MSRGYGVQHQQMAGALIGCQTHCPRASGPLRQTEGYCCGHEGCSQISRFSSFWAIADLCFSKTGMVWDYLWPMKRAVTCSGRSLREHGTISHTPFFNRSDGGGDGIHCHHPGDSQ